MTAGTPALSEEGLAARAATTIDRVRALAVAGVLASTLPVIASPVMSSAERPLMVSSLVDRRAVATVSSRQSGSQRYFRLGLPPEPPSDDGPEEPGRT